MRQQCRIAVKGQYGVRRAPFCDGYMGVVVWWYGWMIGWKTEGGAGRGACGVPSSQWGALRGGRRRSGVCEGRPEGAGGGDHPAKILIGGTHTRKIFVEFLRCVYVTISLFVTFGCFVVKLVVENVL